jgi:hypothetical protein
MYGGDKFIKHNKIYDSISFMVYEACLNDPNGSSHYDIDQIFEVLSESGAITLNFLEMVTEIWGNTTIPELLVKIHAPG